MTSTNSVQTNIQAPAFKGFKSGLKAIAKNKNKIKELEGKPKEVSDKMEQLAGATCAFQTKAPAVLKEIVWRESALGHTEFVKGILSSNAAKNLYK